MTTATLLNGHLYTEGFIIAQFMHTSGNISTHNFISILSRHQCPKMLCAFIIFCIYLHALQTTSDHMEAINDL